MSQLKEVVSQIPGPSYTMTKERASEISCPSATMGKDQEKSQQTPCPSPAKEKGKGKAKSVVPPTVRRSPRRTRKGFDPSQQFDLEEEAELITPLSSSSPANWKKLSLKDTELPEDRVNDKDHSLVFVPEESWVKLMEWSSTSKHEIGLQRKKEQHLFKWVDEALCDEIQLMREQQSRMAEEIEDLRGSFKNTVQEEVMNNKNSGDVGCVGTILSFLCLCSKFD
ncbi:hypothetical protein Bca4012_082591 [Brassica carinata]